MEQMTDRMKFKDKIIENISKAIKSIQEMLYYKSLDPLLKGAEVSLTLYNGDLPCHKLCENLDHALLHGLKQVTHGYWRVVRELTRKEMIKQIDLLTNVTTDLGKGRAWLYASLNEGVLESYIRLLCENEKLLKRYYAKEALMLDEDRMNILLTHASGLDFVKFQLEFDVPYLDLTAAPPSGHNLTSDLESGGGSISPHISSSNFNGVVSESANDIVTLRVRGQSPSDSDTASVASFDIPSDASSRLKTETNSSESGCPMDGSNLGMFFPRSTTPAETTLTTHLHVAVSTDNISLCSQGSTGDPDRHQRLENIMAIGDEVDDGEGNQLEVIRVRNKKGKLVSKTKKAKAVTAKNTSKEKNHYVSRKEPPDAVVINSVETQNDYLDLNTLNVDLKTNNLSSSACLSANHDRNTPQEQKDLGLDVHQSHSQPVPTSGQRYFNLHQLQYMADVVSKHPPGSDSESQLPLVHQPSVQAQIENKITELSSVAPKVGPASSRTNKNVCNDTSTGPEPILRHKLKSESLTPSHKTTAHSKNPGNTLTSASTSVQVSSCDRAKVVAETTHSKKNLVALSKSSGNSSQNAEMSKVPVSGDAQNPFESDYVGEDHSDFYSRNTSQPEQRLSGLGMPSSLSRLANDSANVQMKDYMDYIMETSDRSSADVPTVRPKSVVSDFSLDLDNNLKLQLMLDIFTHEDEQLLKMFVTRENHTEGDPAVIFVLITDHCLYLLHYKAASKTFVLQSSVQLLDLLFVSTGINEQTLNVETQGGKHNQKLRLWLTPGHQALTLSMVKCLADAVKAREHFLPVRSRFSVESEVPLQKVALRKYIARELSCENQDVIISDYSLVFWEDPSSSNSQFQDADAAFKEGTLLLRSQDPLKTHVWKPVYVVLKNSMLCISNKKSDPRPHSYLGLGGDQCVGCRATSTSDREYCVELILAQGGSWYLAGASQHEISEWRHALCLAVSQGMEDASNTMNACIPCCAVLSSNHLFLCHEDLHTKFYRTLGRANLKDVTELAVDEVDQTFFIIDFESQEAGVSSSQWVLYFASAQDLQRCKAAISAAWMVNYQIELPISTINNMALQRHCSVYATQLRQQLTI